VSEATEDIPLSDRERAEGFHCFSTVPFGLLFVSLTTSPTDPTVPFAHTLNGSFIQDEPETNDQVNCDTL
jgi:hypothetical protein